MSLKQYQTYILETILKDKNYNKKFESNDFKEIYENLKESSQKLGGLNGKRFN